MDLEDYRQFVDGHGKRLDNIEGQDGDKPFRELGMTFDEDNFEIALDRLGLRSFDLVESYGHEPNKEIGLKAMIGS